MLFVAFALLAILQVRTAAGLAAPTFCSEDNLLRAFQHTPTPASKYCAKATAYPTFLAVATYPATRLSSACSCFSRIPVDGGSTSTSTTSSKSTSSSTSTTSTSAACQPTQFEFSGTGVEYGIGIDIILTIDRTKACGGGYQIINVCGYFWSAVVSFDPTQFYGTPGNCYYPDAADVFDANGFTFETNDGNTYSLIPNPDSAEPNNYFFTSIYEGYYPTVVDSPCGTTPLCPQLPASN